MRLLELTIHNFRGFGSTAGPISLNGDLLLFFGPNGFGKTSLSEAIEWLFYGSTKRRERGQQFSRNEHANSYKNVHATGDTYVEAIVKNGTGEFKLRRVLESDETSKTFIDDNPASFSSIGINPIEAVYPVIAQNGLQSIIHSKPKDRRDAICAALGIDELTDLKSSLESARSSFQRTAPPAVTTARSEINTLASTLALVETTKDLAKRWGMSQPQIALPPDLDILLAAANFLSGTNSTELDDTLPALRTKRLAVSQNVFNTDSIKLPDDHGQALESTSASITLILNHLVDNRTKIGSVVSANARTFKIALVKFWSAGLTLAEGDICPMCEEDTLTDQKRELLTAKVSSSTESLKISQELDNSLSQTIQAILALRKNANRLAVLGITPEAREKLSALLSQSPAVVDGYLVIHDKWLQAREEFEIVLSQLAELVTNIPALINDPNTVSETLKHFTELEQDFEEKGTALSTSYTNYAKEWPGFDTILQGHISSNREIAKIDAVGKSIKNIDQIKLIGRYNDTIAESQEAIRFVEAKIHAEQTRLLNERGAAIKNIYDRLNVGADVGFHKMEPGNDNIKLHAVSFGRVMPAAATLSECQLNCLGLATYLMRANSDVSPFGFIVLDDPVQSMDDAHAEAFMSDIVPHLLDDHNKQVIVLSHAKKISERLNALHSTRQTKLYHFDVYTQSGPVLTEQISLNARLGEIKHAMKGNEENRKYAVDRLRVLSEQLIRQIYVKVNSTPVPTTYDRATATQLLPLFQTINGTTQQEHLGLKDTIGFCDPAHHTEPGYSPPLQTQIQPHFSRIEALIKKFGI